MECPRKWAWRHIKGVETPQAASAALGTETHSQLETYLGGGSFDFTKQSGYIAASATALLPKPGTPGLELEEHFEFTSSRGLVYHGYIDVFGPDSSVFPGLPKPGDVRAPVVSDHKTTGNFSYAKTPEDLKTDPQGVIYAKAIFEKFPNANEADLVWTYMLTRGANKAKRVHLRVLRDNVTTQFDALELTALQLAATYADGTEPLDLPATRSACKNYGGCPHHPSKGGGCTDISALNPEGKVMTQATEDMLKDLSTRPGVTPPADFALPEWLTAKVDPGPQKPAKVDAAPAMFDLGLASITNLAVSVASPPAPSAQLDMNSLLEGVTKFNPAATPPAINPPGEAAPVSSVLLQPPVAEEPKAKRTRRTKEQIAADAKAEAMALLGTPEVVGDIVVGSVTVGAPVKDPCLAPIPKAPQSGWTLYVDCLPSTGVLMPADHLIAKAHARVKAEAGVIDYRAIDYGKGAGALLACVLDQIDGSWNEDIALNSGTPEGALVCSALSALAPRVVRGVR